MHLVNQIPPSYHFLSAQLLDPAPPGPAARSARVTVGTEQRQPREERRERSGEGEPERQPRNTAHV